MNRISGIRREWEEDVVLAAYRRFLMEPGVENDFYATKALAQRAVWTESERRRLRAQAAAAEVEAGRLARAQDDDHRRRFGFWTGMAVAVGLAVVDAVPAYLAAQTFGLDQWTTAGVTAVLVAALAAAMWAMAHQSGTARRFVLAGLVAGLAAITALRWWYLVVTTGDLTSAVVEAFGLTIFTALLVWFGVLVLGLTKTRQVSRAERRARSLRRQADHAEAVESDTRRRASVAMREHTGRAQVFASRTLDDVGSRGRFVDHVRREVERDGDGSLDSRSKEDTRWQDARE